MLVYIDHQMMASADEIDRLRHQYLTLLTDTASVVDFVVVNRLKRQLDHLEQQFGMLMAKFLVGVRAEELEYYASRDSECLESGDGL